MKKITDVVSKILEYIVGALFLVIAATALSQVFTRYVLRHSLVWAHELDILLMIWAVWLCAAIGIHRKAHLRITLVSDLLSTGKTESPCRFYRPFYPFPVDYPGYKRDRSHSVSRRDGPDFHAHSERMGVRGGPGRSGSHALSFHPYPGSRP